MTLIGKGVVHRGVYLEEPLREGAGLEALHPAFSSSERQVHVLRTIGLATPTWPMSPTMVKRIECSAELDQCVSIHLLKLTLVLDQA